MLHTRSRRRTNVVVLLLGFVTAHYLSIAVASTTVETKESETLPTPADYVNSLARLLAKHDKCSGSSDSGHKGKLLNRHLSLHRHGRLVLRPALVPFSSATHTHERHHRQQHTSLNEETYDFDYFVIGAGSGGIASARRAASYGAKVAVAEKGRLGGTCVNVGCVPKKVMWNAAAIAETLEDMKHYGFFVSPASSGTADFRQKQRGTETTGIRFDWSFIKANRDKYIDRLNGIYDRNLENSGVHKVLGSASLIDNHTVQVIPENNGKAETYTAKHILIATGGVPIMPPGDGIEEHCISSDGFFELEDLPSKAAIVGAGYIAVELAGVLQALGTDTKLVVRREGALRGFDDILKTTLDEEMQRQGIEIYRNTNGVEKVEANPDGTKKLWLKNGEVLDGLNVVIVALGRRPNVDSLNLKNLGIKQKKGGYIQANEYSETSLKSVYALGDVVGETELTPTAIAAGRRLADRLFGGPTFDGAKINHELVPTVVFSHPPIGTIGMTEQEALGEYGEEHVTIYKSKFANLYYGPWQVEADEKPKTAMKLVCVGKKETVVGLHVIGIGADEMLQGFGIALKMGATKADFDSTIAIHPTAAEEFVTMFPWGLAPQETGAKHTPLNGEPSADPLLQR